MSDMPKSLQRVAGFRWIVGACAALLTVAVGWLAWIEMEDDTSPAPRGLVGLGVLVSWFAFIALSCTLLILKRMAAREVRIEKRTERQTTRIIEAIVDQRLEKLADLMEDNNVRPINGRR